MSKCIPFQGCIDGEMGTLPLICEARLKRATFRYRVLVSPLHENRIVWRDAEDAIYSGNSV